MRVKICGITKPEQGQAIAQLGATALGFICVPASPRYISAKQIRDVVSQIPRHIERIGVFANTSCLEICQVAVAGDLTGVQLHGDESPEFCTQLRQLLPTSVEIIKALRVRNSQALVQANLYIGCVDTLLLDAYHPQMLGGTGKTLDWENLQQFCPSCPWLLAGGLTPENVNDALNQLKPNGIDLSSGVERAPGDKDLTKVAHLFQQLEARKMLADAELNSKIPHEFFDRREIHLPSHS
ncbi:phosphoribosylanthranilate isomerase [Gloeocapsopsis dulcis]|uniref:N-(5'-phosphoribosyl)anthranilate isomerase n=1 Tax=Gloeocapsopsis dulcis AAB1 = 1H9 TaxID=1433147 RepID=A0A6N8G088_9CHRO|nr:phosphoribosylanthranilate isomerase [Gloeocapsopsis dulcis]MUL37576.1 N-(5'-phosphoribosyl)anthranilate isomerase [Gloeocapsopsis dulcis AAB1 = 1H9]WNN87988.1 phosphoribosylanthranilate isomerase [Gloeocapsopsis dulcis]